MRRREAQALAAAAERIEAAVTRIENALSTETAGGLAAVVSEVRDVKAPAEAALAEVRALARIARPEAAAPPEAAPEATPMPAGGPGTSGRKAAGMGARVSRSGTAAAKKPAPEKGTS